MTNWRLAGPQDAAAMVALAKENFETEVDKIFTTDPLYYEFNLHQAILKQAFYQSLEQLLVAYDGDKLIAYAWLSRGTRPPYSQDELAEARFVHMDLTLSARRRIELIKEILAHWINWCRACAIPVLVSTSIRQEQTAFMRIHQRMGFSVRGSIAYLNLKEMKCEQ